MTGHLPPKFILLEKVYGEKVAIAIHEILRVEALRFSESRVYLQSGWWIDVKGSPENVYRLIKAEGG